MNDHELSERRSGGMTGWTKLTIAGAVILAAIVALDRLGSIYVDWLWFQSVGLEGVFSTRFIAQAVLFLAAGLAFFAVFIVNVLLARRLAARRQLPFDLLQWTPSSQNDTIIKLGAVGAGVILAIMVGIGQAASWDTVLRFANPTSFGVSDPLFGKDVGFFVFTLPMYDWLHGWLMTTLFLTILGSLAVYIVKLVLPQIPMDEQSLEGGMSNLRLDLDFGASIKAHLSILVALLALGFGLRYWLDTFELVFTPTGLVFGAGYADINARWPMLWVMMGAAVLFALLVLVNIRRSGYGLAAYGAVLWVGVWIVGGAIYPGAMQRFEVQPSELDKERPYIDYNIGFTNQAYGLNRVVEADYPAEDSVTLAEVERNPTTIKNIRLWDPEPLLDTYNQIQSIRLYYDFMDVDVDRYMIDGEYRQVMVSARELSPEKLPSQAQTWVNRRLQFTHGYGAAMSPVNEVTLEGMPELFLQDVPPRGKLPLTRPEIYYGETSSEYVIVKTKTKEFDYPKGDENVYVEYAGTSGVSVGSFLRRLFFAWQFGDVNMLLAEAMTPESKVLYNRNIKDRAQMVAPFLMYDSDPYVVAVDQRLYWILDAYTHTDRYPYSQPVNLGRRSKANYLRNSVKIVTDAYDGSMKFYIADKSDPIVNTYAAIFPSLFQSLDDMPRELRDHLRYPQDLFKIQAELYRTYHMKDARVFYNKEDMWNVPTEKYADKMVPVLPYYVIMRLPGESREEFVLILPYTPPEKNNMITWLAGRSDGEAYGKLVAYKYPKDKLIYGPQQIEARIDQDPRISEQLTLWDQGGSRVLRGNMIVIPIGQSNLYVEPIYLQSEQTKLPEMKRVVLATGNKVVMEPTVSMALSRLFPTSSTPVGRETPPAQTTGPSPAIKELSAAGKALLERYSKLQDEMKAVENELKKMLQSLEGAQ